MGLLADYKAQFRRSNNALIQVILINVTIFIGLNLFWFVSGKNGKQFSDAFGLFFCVPSNLHELKYVPWTFITSFFTHFDTMHLLGNMLCLYFFGKIVIDLVGHKKFLSIYILGGIIGNLTFVGLYQLPQFPHGIALGASGSVLAIAMAAAALAPHYRLHLIFIGPIKIYYIVAAYVFFSFLGLRGSNAGGNMAHLGGAIMGYVYVVSLKKGIDLGKPIENILRFFNISSINKPKIKVTHRKTSTERKDSVDTSKPASQQEIDSILDKISQSGYESLTKEEKEKLFSASKK